MGDKYMKMMLMTDNQKLKKLLHLTFQRDSGFIDVLQDYQLAERFLKRWPSEWEILLLDQPTDYALAQMLQLKRSNRHLKIIVLARQIDPAVLIHWTKFPPDLILAPEISLQDLIKKCEQMLVPTVQTPDDVPTPQPLQPQKNGRICLNPDEFNIVVDRKTVVELRPKEFELISYLVQAPGRVFTREELMREIWQYKYFADDRTIDTHIKTLRKKIPFPCIATVWGVGYKYDET